MGKFEKVEIPNPEHNSWKAWQTLLSSQSPEICNNSEAFKNGIGDGLCFPVTSNVTTASKI